MAKNMIPTHASYLADVARAAHQTGKDLTLDDVAAVIEAVNSLGAADDTLARTGNTARGQEMYVAGIRTGEENAKHNAAIRASMPDGWELVTRKTCYALMHDGAVIATLAGPESETNAAIIARMLAAPGVSTVEDASFPSGAIVNGRVLADRLEAYPFESQGGDLRLCSDWVEFRRCFEYLAEWVGSRAPAAGDALQFLADTEGAIEALTLPGQKTRYRVWWPAVGELQAEWFSTPREAIDAAIAAQRKGDA